MTRYSVEFTGDHSQVGEDPEVLATGIPERQARQIAACALGESSLRGLFQVDTPRGFQVYSRGASDNDGSSVELVVDGNDQDA